VGNGAMVLAHRVLLAQFLLIQPAPVPQRGQERGQRAGCPGADPAGRTCPVPAQDAISATVATVTAIA
jgi:hypothetical protein